MSIKKDARILGIRLDQSEVLALEEIEKATTLAPVSIARAAITAVIRRWNINHELVLPFHLVTTTEFNSMTSFPKTSASYPATTGGIKTIHQEIKSVEDAHPPAPVACALSA